MNERDHEAKGYKVTFEAGEVLAGKVDELCLKFGMSTNELWTNILTYGIKTLEEMPADYFEKNDSGSMPELNQLPVSEELKGRITDLMAKKEMDLDDVMLTALESGVTAMELDLAEPQQGLLEPHKAHDLLWSPNSLQVANWSLKQREN